jgi:hypothetical protein
VTADCHTGDRRGVPAASDSRLSLYQGDAVAYSILTGDIFEFTIRGELYLQTVETVLHYAVTMSPPANDAWNQIHSFLNFNLTSALVNAMQQCWSNDTLVTSLRGQIVAPIRRPVVVQPCNLTGGAGAVANTANVSAAITKRTDVITHRHTPTGKGGVGGVRIFGVPVTAYAAGKLLNPYLANLASLANIIPLGTDFNPDGQIIPCLWHRNPIGSAAYDELVECNPEPTVRVMRRRTLGLGI